MMKETGNKYNAYLLDSHCHLENFDDCEVVVQRAIEKGIKKLVTIGTELNDFEKLRKIVEKFPDYIEQTIGIHPDNASRVDNIELENYFYNLEEKPVIGIGEIGLDYKNSPNLQEKNRQKYFFEYQLDVAKKHGLPVCIHMRDSFEDLFCLLKNQNGVDAVFHCFCGGVEEARRVLDLGAFISFSGIVTFKNAAKVQEAAKFIPLDRLLVETDAPYLAPTPYRGKVNEPAYVSFVFEFLANLRGSSQETLICSIKDNFFRFFTKAKQNW